MLLSVVRGKHPLHGKLKVIFRPPSKAPECLSIGRTDVFPVRRCLEQAVLIAGVTLHDLSKAQWYPGASTSFCVLRGRDVLLFPKSQAPGAASPAGPGATGGTDFAFSSLPSSPKVLWTAWDWKGCGQLLNFLANTVEFPVLPFPPNFTAGLPHWQA